MQLDVRNNELGTEGTRILVEALNGNVVLGDLNIASNGITWCSKTQRSDLSAVMAVGSVLPAMEGLMTLNLSSNSLDKDGTTVLADVLAGNETVTALNISNSIPNILPTREFSALADAISSMRALTCLDISTNCIGGQYEGSGRQTRWRANITGVNTLAAALPKCT